MTQVSMIELISMIVQVIIYAGVIMLTSGFMANKVTKELKAKIDVLSGLALNNQEEINNLKAILLMDKDLKEKK